MKTRDKACIYLRTYAVVAMVLGFVEYMLGNYFPETISSWVCSAQFISGILAFAGWVFLEGSDDTSVFPFPCSGVLCGAICLFGSGIVLLLMLGVLSLAGIDNSEFVNQSAHLYSTAGMISLGLFLAGAYFCVLGVFLIYKDDIFSGILALLFAILLIAISIWIVTEGLFPNVAIANAMGGIIGVSILLLLIGLVLYAITHAID